MFAIAAHADEREAHVREVEQFGQSLPEGSYGRRNRQAIAARETRVAARLRAVERAYRMAIERDAEFRPPEPTRASALLSMRPTGRSSWSRAPRALRPYGKRRYRVDMFDTPASQHAFRAVAAFRTSGSRPAWVGV